MPRTLTPELMRGIRHADIPVPAMQMKLEVRLLSLYITFQYLNDLVGLMGYVFGIAPSMLARAATLSHGPWLVGGAFVLAFVLALPHAVALAFLPRTLWRRLPRLLATISATLVMITWGYLSVEAYRLDVGPLHWLYLRQGVGTMFLAMLYALSLNAQLLRELYESAHRK